MGWTSALHRRSGLEIAASSALVLPCASGLACAPRTRTGGAEAMAVQALGYVGIEARAPEDWAGYGTAIPWPAAGRAQRRAARLPHGRPQAADRRHARRPRRRPLLRLGGRRRGGAGALAARLEAAGVPVARGDRALAGQRRVADLIVDAGPARQPRRARPWRREHRRALPPRPQHQRLPHRRARHGPCGAAPCRGWRTCCPSTATCWASASPTTSLNPFHAYFLHVNPRHHRWR